MNAIVSRKREPRLQLREVLDWLIEDGLLRNEDAREFVAPSQRTGEPPPHPISLIAQQGWADAQAPLQRMLTAESLTQWLAGRTGLGYQRIDPLAIDVTQVTAVVPYAYAARLRILPIKVTPEQLEDLMDDAKRGANATLTVDLENQTIAGPDGGEIKFDIDPFKKKCLLEGLDDVGLTLQNKTKIDSFEKDKEASQGWLNSSMSAAE